MTPTHRHTGTKTWVRAPGDAATDTTGITGVYLEDGEEVEWYFTYHPVTGRKICTGYKIYKGERK